MDMAPAREPQPLTPNSESPALKLPNEITSEIFLHFLPVYPRCPPLTGILSPTCLTHICRRWREIALTTSALWRAIPFFTYSKIPFTRRFDIFNLWLSRSRFCPLSIEIDDAGDPRSTEIYEVLAVAAFHYERWEHLKLHLSNLQNFPTSKGRMPLLRHLDLKLADFTPFVTIVTSQDLPLLRVVALDLWNDDASDLKLPWAQLTSLSLRNGLRIEYTMFLQQTPNLVQCTLGRLGLGSAHTPDVTLPYLKSLTMVLHDDDIQVEGFRGYLETFIVPALSSLRIPELCLAPNPLDTLASFISKSGCKLDHVCIAGNLTVSEDSYRSAFPSIGTFTFEKRPVFSG
ncbi:hypothetical protein DFH06DRAFT_566637, partial [Mycena polygramma]